MRDATELLRAARGLRAAGEPYVISTVVRVRGSSYRRPGARLISTEDRRIAGSVSGGCLEGHLVRTGWWRTRQGPVVVTFDSTEPEEPDAVLGCGGVVDVLLERSSEHDPLAFADATISAGTRGAIATVFVSSHAAYPVGTRWLRPEVMPPPIAAAAREALGAGRTSVLHHAEQAGELEVLVEAIVPPVELFVFGAGLDAVPVTVAALALGWRVHVWSGVPRFEHAARFPGSSVLGPDLDEARLRIEAADRAVAVVMGHDPRRDRAALAMLLGTRVSYLGVLGPRHRTAFLAEGLPAGVLDDPRVHAPVGLDLGAETSAEIALAVISEALASVRGASALPLRTRAAIHG